MGKINFYIVSEGFAEKAVWDSKKEKLQQAVTQKLQQVDFSHRKFYLYYSSVIFSLFRTANMSLGLRVKDRLDGHSNYSVWKERM